MKDKPNKLSWPAFYELFLGTQEPCRQKALIERLSWEREVNPEELVAVFAASNLENRDNDVLAYQWIEFLEETDKGLSVSLLSSIADFISDDTVFAFSPFLVPPISIADMDRLYYRIESVMLFSLIKETLAFHRELSTPEWFASAMDFFDTNTASIKELVQRMPLTEDYLAALPDFVDILPDDGLAMLICCLLDAGDNVAMDSLIICSEVAKVGTLRMALALAIKIQHARGKSLLTRRLGIDLSSTEEEKSFYKEEEPALLSFLAFSRLGKDIFGQNPFGVFKLGKGNT